MSVNRRYFLKICGSASGGLLLNIVLPGAVFTNIESVFEPNLFVKIESDNTVVFKLTKQEMGQGIATGLSMIFADELGAELEKMKVIQADYDPKFDHSVMGITGGSSSIHTCWNPLRRAAAAARELLIQAASQTWNVPVHECYAEGGKVVHKPTSRAKTFGELAAKASELPVPADVKLKDPGEFKYIGKPVRNIRTKIMVSGLYKYGIDVVVPGMLYASIERSPVHQGTIKSYDDREARRLPGVVDIIKIKGRIKSVSVGVPGWDHYYDYTIEEGLAVIATSTWAAMNARKKLRITWDGGKNAGANSNTFRENIARASSDLAINETKGDVDAAFEHASKILNASYEIPYMAHCLMEPLNTVASVKGDRCELWSGTQFGKRFVEEVSTVTGIPFENVTCHVLPAGGGFGRRWEPDFVVEAALLSQSLQKPVKVTWTREDDIQHDHYHAVQHDSHRIAIDDKNSITAWEIDQYSCSKFLKGAPWNPYSYSIQNYRSRKMDLPSPIETGPWRSVDDHKDVFTLESFIDEVAHSVKTDPLTFRLDLLNRPLVGDGGEQAMKAMEADRLLTRQVLELAAEKAGWGKKRNLGIAVARFSSHCAQVAEVDVVKGKLTVRKVTVAIHCGIAVNPSMVEAQLQGAVIFALQALKYGGINVLNGRVQQSNFHDYKMLRIDEVPEINVHIVASSHPPKGVGEPGVPPLAPAVLNALFAATGKRIRKMPVTKDDLG